MDKRRLILVDHENVQRIDLSVLDESYHAIIYIGAKQNTPRAASKEASQHRFRRVEFQKIEGSGKNALDFHIAFQLGRIFETSRDTECIVLSKDKGFDPLLAHLKKIGLVCRRIDTMDALVVATTYGPPNDLGPLTVCRKCKKTKTIEHYGGRWCSNCGLFATPPDPALLPSNQIENRASNINYFADLLGAERNMMNEPCCAQCHQRKDMATGIYDDGEWICGDCVADYG